MSIAGFIRYLGPAPSRGQRRVDEAYEAECPDMDQFLHLTIPDQETLDLITARGDAHGNFIWRRDGRGVDSFYFSQRAHPEIVTKSPRFLGGLSREIQSKWVDGEAPELGILGGDIVCDALCRIYLIQFGYYADQLRLEDIHETFVRIDQRLFAPWVWVVTLTDPIAVKLCNPKGTQLKAKPLEAVRDYDDLSYLTTKAFLLRESDKFFVDTNTGLLYPNIFRRDEQLNSQLKGTEGVNFEVENTRLTKTQVWDWETSQLRWLAHKFDPSVLANPLIMETTFDKIEIDKKDGRIQWTFHQEYHWFPIARKLKKHGEPQRTVGWHLEDKEE